MKILYIDGFQTEKAGVDIVQALRDMGHDVQTYSEEPMIVTVLHETVVQELKDYICAHEVELLVSMADGDSVYFCPMGCSLYGDLQSFGKNGECLGVYI